MDNWQGCTWLNYYIPFFRSVQLSDSTNGYICIDICNVMGCNETQNTQSQGENIVQKLKDKVN